MPDVQADFLQLFRHPWPAVASQAETRLFLDMCQHDEIGSLSGACGAASESTQTACADTNDIAQAISWKARSVFFDKPKSHCFRPAKNWVAFFRISLSSLRSRISRRSRSFSLARLRSSFDTTSVSQCAVIHLFSVDIPTPRSSATCLRVNPLVSAIRTASCRNSSVRFNPIVHLLCCSKCYQRSGIKPRQVHNDYQL